jgi:hypothetical protein
VMGIRRPPTAAHRPAPARIAQVSGRPPWEPAPRPDSELPWAQAPVPPRGGTGSLPKPEQTRPALPSWDALADDVWPGGPRGAAPHPPVSSPADRNVGGPAGRGSTGAPAMGARPLGRPVPAAGLAPPQPDAQGRARSAEERPGHKRNRDAGTTPFRADQSEPASAAERIGRPGAGSGFSPASKPAKATASPPTDSVASPPDSAVASPPPRSAASRPSDSAAGPPADPAASPATGAATSPPDRATANPPTDASASEPPAPLPRRLSAPPLRPPSPFPPSQPGAGSSLFRSTSQPPFPPAPRPATEPGAAGTWRPSAGTGSFPPTRKPAPGAPATDAAAPDATAADGPAADAAAAEPGLPDAGEPQHGGPRVMGGPGSVVGPAGPGAAFPQAARPGAGGSRPASGVPPWEITDSFPAVPSASAETEQADPEPNTLGPLGGPPSGGTAGTGDSTESFPAVDPAAEQRSFPRAGWGDGNESFPAPRPRTDEDAFRLFPPVRRTGNQPPAPPATDDQD